jgi:hypothetical protein
MRINKVRRAMNERVARMWRTCMEKIECVCVCVKPESERREGNASWRQLI